MKKQVKLPKIDTYVFTTILVVIAIITMLKSCKGDRKFKYKIDPTYSIRK